MIKTRVVSVAMVFVLLLIAGLAMVQAQSPAAPASAGSERLVAAYYYAWFDENTWKPNIVSDMPTQPYRSADRGVIARHVDQAKNAGIDALVVSWLGTGNQTDSNLAMLLSVSAEKDFHASLDFETGSPFMPTQGDIINNLRYAIQTYANHPNFMRYNGKPVIFFWRLAGVPTAPGQSALQAWQSIRQQVDPNHDTLWIAEGDNFSYLNVFDGQHGYSIAWSGDPAGTLASWASRVRSYSSQSGINKLWVATVMPGYNDTLITSRSDRFARDRQGGAYYNSTWSGAIQTQPDMVIITSFNEWVEGSQIEPSASYGDLYLNLTRDNVSRYKTAAAIAPAASGTNYALANGHFFTEANGKPLGSDKSGFAVTNDGGVPMWDEYQRLGGVQGLGYPISHRFIWDGFVCQVTQRGVMQWRPEVGRVYLINVFDMMHQAGKDDWLKAVRSTPSPLDASFDVGKSWDQTVASRLALLDANPAMRAQYYSTPDPMTTYGLPTTAVTDMGNHYVIRLQRAVFQYWKQDVPWAKAGTVTVANGGDVSKEAGLFSADILTPQAP